MAGIHDPGEPSWWNTSETACKSKVLFLDVDGVLNNRRFRRSNGVEIEYDPDNICHLNRILRATNCTVVLSSDRRYGILEGPHTLRTYADLLRTHGVKSLNLVGTTRGAEALEYRGEQIKDYLIAHPEISVYVVLDDYSPACFEGLSHVQTDGGEGLTKEIAEEVIRRLGFEDVIG